MKKADLFFPSWAIAIYMPVHIYYVFQLAKLSYAPRSMGFALFPILLFGFVSSLVLYFVLNIWLYRTFENRTLKEVLKGKSAAFRPETKRPRSKADWKKLFFRKKD